MDNQAYGGYPQAGVPYPQGVAHGLGSKINSSSSLDIDFVNSGFYLLLLSNNIVNLLFIFLSMFLIDPKKSSSLLFATYAWW